MTWSLNAGIEGKNVIVTGAAGGIGAAVVAELLEAGASVIAVDVSMESLTTTFGETPAVRLIEADLRDISTHEAIVESAAATDSLYGLVHCAAVLVRRADISEVTEADWDLQVDVNLKATFFLCRRVAEVMKSAGAGGRIVTFGSQGWWTGGFGGSVVYASTKGGVVSMTRGMARAYGSAGITVNCISPGQARTEMLLTGLDERILESMTSQTPLGRIAEPAEVASVALFLLSDHASFITGSTLNVSGGFLMY